MQSWWANPHHHRSASRVRTAWSDHMRTLAPIVDTKFINAARPMVPLIEAAAVKLVGLANMNRVVHTPIYNRLIASVASNVAA